MARAGFSCLVWITLLGAVCSNVAAQAASASAILSFAARALLREGQAPEVLAYLEQCRVFWETGAPWLDIWEEKIRAGREPNFLMNLW